MYTPEPGDKEQFTERFDRMYGRWAAAYDLGVKWFPIWRTWISQALPHIRGPRVLEVSFGTGYLLTRYADAYQTWAIDYNWPLVRMARDNLEAAGAYASIQQAAVEHLPYRSESFNTVVNTMAFSGYPDGAAALAEIKRVLKQGGRLVLVDVNYPQDRNWLGTKLTRLWVSLGDIIRDMDNVFRQTGFDYVEKEVGGFGSVHLYVATRRA